MLSSLTANYIRTKLFGIRQTSWNIKRELIRLKALLRWAYRNEYLGSTECIDRLERFKDIPHVQKIEDKFLEAKEVLMLLDSMTVKQWKDLTAFLVLSGLRFGEAAALQRSDLDMEKRIIKSRKHLIK